MAPPFFCFYFIFDIKVSTVFKENVFSSDFDYVEDVKGYTISSHKRPMLVDQRGYTYQISRFSKSSSKAFWRCQRSRSRQIEGPCYARAISLHNKITLLSGVHNHNPPEIQKLLLSDKCVQ